ncbi:beta-ketoacyl-ACP synthase II [Paenibacillus herberti]|uniref:3-oxoacyl-[acyl-carrier-protein] synthase 2 n=1 Tax=Paenibacillus herberti TaxID=1619309 RepID=A0A229P5K4_9BACL|nr:beta-ketoacyl-ACP synthase II [Paenibacillus herberti]OXM17185.1 beta-ketoacyl-[acyl-carrier-protein] synthase II [Paenibacillus herberti]
MNIHRSLNKPKPQHRVVITGMGAVSPFGHNVSSLWEGLAAGRSGIRRIRDSGISPELLQQMDGDAIAGFVPDWDGEARFGRKEARKMDRFVQFALAAAEEALQQSGLDNGKLVPERTGVYVGSGIGGIGTLMEQANVLFKRGRSRVSPTLVPMMIANMAAAMISIRFGITGPVLAPVTACSIGNTAIGEAMRLIRNGGADVVIAGGAEAAVSPVALAGFGNATALASFKGDPAAASRPFDADRSGFVIAEGAGIVVLESLEHAMGRGAEPLAEVLGYGATSDAWHMVATDPSGKGAAAAMRLALEDGGLTQGDISVISAHATGTSVGDLSETRSIRSVFGEGADRIPVTANKSMTGHMLGAAGGAEAIALVHMLREGLIPPTLNRTTRDPLCDLDYVPLQARHAELRVGLSNSFGFGGHNAVIALGRFN